LIAVGFGLPLGLAHLVLLERLDVQIESRAILPGTRQRIGHLAPEKLGRSALHDARGGSVEENPSGSPVIFPDASRTGDITTNGTPEEDNTDSKRRSRSLTRSSARARSMNTAALRAQMSAMRISRSVGLRGVGKCAVSVPSAHRHG
jgi:hypothetical protein